MTGMFWYTMVVILLIYIIWRSATPYFYMKPMAAGQFDSRHYCYIDIRDFVSSYRLPMAEAENIPLSYLNRAAKQKKLCDKEIVIIAEDRKAAKMATRILKRKHKKKIYYITL